MKMKEMNNSIANGSFDGKSVWLNDEDNGESQAVNQQAILDQLGLI
jgi:hypothetical protein